MSEFINPSLSLNNRSKERFVFGVFNGNFSISVFSGQPGGKPVFGNNMAVPDMLKVRKLLASVASMPPSNQKALTVTARSDDGFKPVGSICIGKDDEGISYIEVQFKSSGNARSIRFNTDFFGTVNPSERERSKQVDSADGIDAIIWWLDNILPTAICFSKLPPKSGPRGGDGAAF